jgi:CDP-diacylglycerol--glycerol-3-phosphate 3-phosphatidyltransferase
MSAEGTAHASLTLASAAPALAFATLLAFSVPVFAVRSWARRERGAERPPATRSLDHWPREWLLWLVSPLERAFIGASVSPDLFNFLGLGFGVAAGVVFARGPVGLAGWLVLLAGVCDVFDGRVARGRRIASPYGAFLDSTLDRFAEAFVYVGIGWRLAPSPTAGALTVLALGGSMLVSYARARGEALGFQCKDGVMQRAQRVVLLAVVRADLDEKRVRVAVRERLDELRARHSPLLPAVAQPVDEAPASPEHPPHGLVARPSACSTTWGIVTVSPRLPLILTLKRPFSSTLSNPAVQSIRFHVLRAGSQNTTALSRSAK